MIGPVRNFLAGRWRVILTFALAIALQVFAWSRLRAAMHHDALPSTAADAPMHALAPLLQGLAALLISVFLIARDLAPFVAAPFSALIDSVYLGSGKMRPPLDYRLADFYVRRGRTEDALAEYSRLIGNHPRDFRSYRDGIDYAMAQNRRDLARKWFRKARWRLGAAQLQELAQLLERRTS